MEELIFKFKENVKVQSGYPKWCTNEVINELIEYFDVDIEPMYYGDTIKESSLDLVLNFYSKHYKKYYPLIIKGLENGTIQIGDDVDKTVCTLDGVLTIKNYPSDEFLYCLIHELAHYIDCNTKRRIISIDWDIFGEVPPFVIEKKFETLYEDSYHDIIEKRKNNRLYYEVEALKAIKIMLRYEEYYKKHGSIDDIIDINEIKAVMQYNGKNTVNLLLRYPIANLLTEYMILNSISLVPRLDKILRDIPLFDVMKDGKVRKRVLNEKM